MYRTTSTLAEQEVETAKDRLAQSAGFATWRALLAAIDGGVKVRLSYSNHLHRVLSGCLMSAGRLPLWRPEGPCEA